MSLKIYQRLSTEPASANVLIETLAEGVTSALVEGLAAQTGYTFTFQREITGETFDPVELTAETIAATIANEIGYAELSTIDATHPDNPLALPSYDGSTQGTHPSVVDLGADAADHINGYRYWMAYTPYPFADILIENPSILASHDRTTWIVPTGLTNPIEPAPASGHNSDTELVLGYDGKLYCYWRHNQTNDNRLYVRSSSDGINWSAKTQVLQETTNDVLSPTIVKENDGYAMYYIGNITSIYKRFSLDPLDFQAATKEPCTYEGLPTGAEVWHFSIRKVNGKDYVALNNRYNTNTDGELMFGSVVDNHFTFYPLLSKEVGTWIETAVYRATFIPLSFGSDWMKLAMWYGGVSAANEWQIGYTEFNVGTPPGEEGVHLLDTYYHEDSVMALSLQKLRTAQQYGIRVRRASDDAETDVELPETGSIDLTSIVSAGGTFGDWVGAGTAYVKTWYNQRVHGIDVDNTTKATQPKIVINGVLSVKNALAALDYVLGNLLSCSALSQLNPGNDLTFFGVSATRTTQDLGSLFSTGTNANGHRIHALRDSRTTPNRNFLVSTEAGDSNVNLNAALVTTNPVLTSGIIDGTNKIMSGWNNGQAGSQNVPFTGNYANEILYIGYWGNAATQLDGQLQEIIIYSGKKDADRSAIEADINSRYSIY